MADTVGADIQSWMATAIGLERSSLAFTLQDARYPEQLQKLVGR
jgi:hypothetical protein